MAVFPTGNDLCRLQFLDGISLAAQVAVERIPRVAGIPQTIFDNRMIGKLALPFQITKAGLSVRRLERLMKKSCSLPVDFQDPHLEFPGTVGLCILRHSHPRALRQKLDGFDIIEIFDAPDKGNHIAPRTAAEAIKRLGIGVDDKRRRFFRMKRTKRLFSAALAAQRHIGSNHIFNVALLQKLLNE